MSNFVQEASKAMRAAQANTEEVISGSHMLCFFIANMLSSLRLVLPRCSPVLPQCSLATPPCSLATSSEAALLPFHTRARGVYIIYILRCVHDHEDSGRALQSITLPAAQHTSPSNYSLYTREKKKRNSLSFTQFSLQQRKT